MNLDFDRVIASVDDDQLIPDEVGEAKRKKVMPRQEVEIECKGHLAQLPGFDRPRQLSAKERVGPINLNPCRVLDRQGEDRLRKIFMGFDEHANDHRFGGGKPRAGLTLSVRNSDFPDPAQLATISEFLPANLDMQPFVGQKQLDFPYQCCSVRIRPQNRLGRLQTQPEGGCLGRSFCAAPGSQGQRGLGRDNDFGCRPAGARGGIRPGSWDWSRLQGGNIVGQGFD